MVCNKIVLLDGFVMKVVLCDGTFEEELELNKCWVLVDCRNANAQTIKQLINVIIIIQFRLVQVSVIMKINRPKVFSCLYIT